MEEIKKRQREREKAEVTIRREREKAGRMIGRRREKAEKRDREWGEKKQRYMIGRRRMERHDRKERRKGTLNARKEE